MRLTVQQIEAIHVASDHGGRLERWLGGYWTYPGCPQHKIRPCPEWYAETYIIGALVRKGLLVYDNFSTVQLATAELIKHK